MEKLRDYGILGTEMESAGLYLLAAKLHFRALSVLTVSDLIFGDEKQPLKNVSEHLMT